MIYLTRLNHTPVLLNAELIEYVETTPDTVITLTTGQKLVVLESTDEIIRRVVEFRREIAALDPAAWEKRGRNGEPLSAVPKDERYGR